MLSDCVALFNNNIGCIETKYTADSNRQTNMFNNNIGCIETLRV